MVARKSVFISYSHENDEHASRVRALADQLRLEDLEVWFDQDVAHPPNGWIQWMNDGLDRADFVLMVCTEAYLRRVEGREPPGVGQGVRWEGRQIYNRVYGGATPGSKFIPILFGEADVNCVPQPLRDFARYQLSGLDERDKQFQRLVEYLTGSVRTGSPRRPRTIRIRLAKLGDGEAGYGVRLEADGYAPAETRFACDPWGERTTSALLSNIDANRCTEDDLRYVGAQLCSGALSGELQSRYREIRQRALHEQVLCHLRFNVPRELEGLPWEALYDTAFLATDETSCIIRETPENIAIAAPPRRRDRPVGVLLLLPDGTELDLAREQEVIEHWAKRQGSAVRLQALTTRVTQESIRAALRSGEWDVVHFGGHARVNERGEVMIRLNGETGETWMDGERFAALFNVSNVRLVVLNCCRAASVDPVVSKALSGLGPFLMRRGVPAVVAMRYDIPDRVALRFAEEFYRCLFAGAEPGRVDLAVESGRAVVYQTEPQAVRGFITPVLFLTESYERLLDLPPLSNQASAVAVSATPGKSPADAWELPGDLIAAIREQRCVPILGPGLLRASAVRSDDATVAPGPRQLALKLAEISRYPQMEDFEASERLGEWLDGFLLQWVCEHLSSQKRIRHEMLRTIKDAYQRCRPPEAIRLLASWKVPGHVCTFIDGLLAQAVNESGKRWQVMNALQREPPTDPALPLLVQLSGSWRDDRSLVLTEEQHNELWDRLSDLPEWVSNLVLGDYGRSLLFLGVHPRDMLSRRLCAKLINKETRNRVGLVFFVCESPTPADEAYWNNFDVQWIRGPADEVIRELTCEANREAAR